jgi:hypothetical protein
MLMDGIGGKNMAFKIKWQPKWKTISVVCYREGDVLATLVSSKFPEAVVCINEVFTSYLCYYFDICTYLTALL